jgi:microcystin-dependent protein
MAQPYVGEIRMFAGNFNPAGWQFCSGQLLPISQYETLFNLIGTTYGGDGQSNFALPDLRGRAPVHFGTSPVSGTSYQLAQTGGGENVTLTTQQIPSHNHPVQATTTGQTLSPGSNAFPALTASAQSGTAIYDANTPTVNLNANSIGNAGGSQPHDNMQPYLVLNYIISMFGIFPSQT